MRLKLIPAILLLAAIGGGCRSNCVVKISNRHLAINSLNVRTFCVTVFTGSSRKHKGNFNLVPLVQPHLKGLLVDGASMPTLKSQITARLLLNNNTLQLTSFAETCEFIGCKTGLLCAFSEYRGAGDTRSVKVTLAWVEAEQHKVIAIGTGITDLNNSSDMEDFKLYCGKSQQADDFFDFAAFKVVNKLFKQVKSPRK
jgi:hypothetical protein